MNFPDVVKVVELGDWNEVNKYLELGWKYASIYTTAYDTEVPRIYHQMPHYILVWPIGEPKYPPYSTSELPY